MQQYLFKRPAIAAFHPPVDPSIDVEFSIDEESNDAIDVDFLNYIQNDPGVIPSYYLIEQEDTTDLSTALDTLSDKFFKYGDYIIICNATKTKFHIFLYTPYDWVTFSGKNAFSKEDTDIVIKIDEEDD